MLITKKLFLQSYFVFNLAIVTETKKPYSIRLQAVWRLECELGVITDPECPVDGGWAPWGPWTGCQGLCDDMGHRHRTRQCNNPPPSQDGIQCSGLAEQSEPCFLSNCTVDDFRKLVEGDVIRLQVFHELEAVPALMERCLPMECPYEAIEAALANDNTWQLNPNALWNSLQCVKHNLGCPVFGEWGPWGAWSVCDARCGPGLRWRLRRCDNPPASDAHLICNGDPFQSQSCEGDQCATDSDSLEDTRGHWCDWGEWTTCTEQCGTGIRRRRRICNEIHRRQSPGVWGTHCRGQHDQLEVCENPVCVLNGGWSGWSTWGPCSQTCGAGRRSRTRSCTRPVPAGGGTTCVGPRTEVGSCNLAPCEVYSHTVAVLNGESFLQYDFNNKRSSLFHFYIRFMPLSPHGTLVRRGTIHNPHVRLSMQKWHLCLEASGTDNSCDLPRTCSTEVIEPAVWHSVLVTVTSEAASLRLDDSHVAIKTTFPCNPDLPNDKVDIFVGEKLHGEIQELLLNFIPLNMMIERNRVRRKSDFYPMFVSNVAYERSNSEEAYLSLENGQYLRMPCFDSQDEWQLRLTVKSKRDSGTILFLLNDQINGWLYVALQNMRLKIKLSLGDVRSESSSSSEFAIDQWLDVLVSKKKGADTIEAAVNSAERLHVFLAEETPTNQREPRAFFRRAKHQPKLRKTQNLGTGNLSPNSSEEKEKSSEIMICNDEFYIGGVAADIKKIVPEDFPVFEGILASLYIDNKLQDLHNSIVESYKDDKVIVSSRTASVSGSYHETAWGDSNNLNLTCLHTRKALSPHSAQWLFLDTLVTDFPSNKKIRSLDDGRVLRLVASADNDLRGFYTCRTHSNRRTRNVITYGVIGKIQYPLSGPDITTMIAVLTTGCLILVTFLWLITEGINDLRVGYGFFRDAHLSPQEEADAVCKFIDDNSHLIESKSQVREAKARARRKAEKLASRSSFAAQEPQGMMQVVDPSAENLEDSTSPEPHGLPALPEVESLEQYPAPHNIYRCEPCYISSPRHGTVTSLKSKITSSSSLEASPRVLCSRLLMAKKIQSSKVNILTRKNKSLRNPYGSRKSRSNFLTIKSSGFLNLSPAQKVLQKFQQLQTDDVVPGLKK